MNPMLPQQVVTTMAKRVYRMHHFIWHTTRYNWLIYPEGVQQKIRDLGWEPPRPALENGSADEPILTNDSGEDYLYMHRQWIAGVNAILAEVADPDYPRVEGWVALPPPGDADFPVPPAWFNPEALPEVNLFISRSKLDINFERRFKYWERLCADPTFLRGLSLGELGSIIEGTLHLGMRSRWASVPAAERPDPAPGTETIAVGWDNPRYDFLRDPYAMHVNPIYWKFYGWVDDRIEDWKVANGVFGNDFWKATWLGKMPELPEEGMPLLAALDDPENAQQHVAEMEQVVRAIAEAGGS